MYQYTLSSDGESVGVRSDTDLTSTFAKWKGLIHFTGVTISPAASHEFEVVYRSTDSEPVAYPVVYSEKSVAINLPFMQLRDGEVLLYAALPFLEVLHQRRQVVTMHAAAVELGGKAVLLLGKVGAGKTSLTLSLCRNHGARLIGNDLVKVGLAGQTVSTFAGSKYFFLRQESIKRNIPDLLSLFPQSQKDPWTHKIYYGPEKLGIAICPNQVPISRSYLVHVDETMDELYTVTADDLGTRLYLYEDMSRYIRGTAVALLAPSLQFMGYVPPLDTPSFYHMRVGLTERLISSTEMTYMSGSLHAACQHIVKKAEG